MKRFHARLCICRAGSAVQGDPVLGYFISSAGICREECSER